MAQDYDLIMIGEGVSALTCASQAARAGLKAATFEANLYGGLVLNVTDLDGYPGAESGTHLATELMRASADAGVARYPSFATLRSRRFLAMTRWKRYA